VLGPQRPTGNIPAVVTAAGVRGPVALIAAGWRYDEDRDEPLRADLGLPVHNLGLYDAYVELEREAPDLAAAHARKQAVLIRVKATYRALLRPALDACLAALGDDPDPAKPWFRAAVAQVQVLDRLFLDEIDGLHRTFSEETRPLRHPLVRRFLGRTLETLEGCEAVLIAGGHVAILRNRLFFFGLDELLRGRRVFGWSAGAMVLAERVWLYHDRSARGIGSMELLDRGLGLVRGIDLLPHARSRLALDRPDVMTVLAARLAPARAIGLENGAVLDADGASLGDPAAVLSLGPAAAAA
jgi:hypothetical protein